MSNLSPAYVIRQILLDAGIGVAIPASEQAIDPDAWLCYIGHMPDVNGSGGAPGTVARAVPQNAICVYDVPGMQSARCMRGERNEHPGYQIRVRSTDYSTAFFIIRQICTVLDAVGGEVAANTQSAIVPPTADGWRVWCVKRDDVPFHSSNENGRFRYEMFSFNGTLTYEYLTWLDPDSVTEMADMLHALVHGTLPSDLPPV
jgi:hypothetical protein